VTEYSGGVVVKSGEPAFVRVREAAVILGISKSAAYELANAWLATEGEAGLPAVRMGRCILVPRAALERLSAVGSEERDKIGLMG
jgi:excisionase family DNA binding protein